MISVGGVPEGQRQQCGSRCRRYIEQGGGDFDCLISGEEKGVVGLVGLEPTISPL